ncbi:MAG: hypothetical protein Q8K92_25065 [Leadbetterella sp.]|jgi:hypothetical protein|nr:hypothetical protein [Leadbetterella sp.]
METTQNKDSNINFRVTEQRKLKLQKEALTKKMTLSDLLNKIIEKNYEPPIDKKANHQDSKTVEGEKIDKKGMYILIIVLGAVTSIWIIVSAIKKINYSDDWRKSRSDLPSQNNM